MRGGGGRPPRSRLRPEEAEGAEHAVAGDDLQEDAPVHAVDPRAVSAGFRVVRGITVTGALATAMGATVNTYLAPEAPTELIVAATMFATLALTGVARWWWYKFLGPVGEDLAEEPRWWIAKWRIDRFTRAGIFSHEESLELQRELAKQMLKRTMVE